MARKGKSLWNLNLSNTISRSMIIKCCGEIYNNDFCIYKIYLNARFIANLSSYYCLKLLLNISELTSYKKGDEILHLYLKEVNSIPKNIGNLN
jgi:hypothetical protein